MEHVLNWSNTRGNFISHRVLIYFQYTMYFDDLEECQYASNAKGFVCLKNIKKDLNLYLNLFCFIVCRWYNLIVRIFNIQNSFNTYSMLFSRYCKKWQLCYRGNLFFFFFTFGSSQLEVVNNFEYLGVTFCKNNF